MSPLQKKICIIGAGSSGLAALKVLKDSPRYKDGLWTAVVFEARQDIGGIWLPAPPDLNPPLTPLYDSLTTNLPHPMMASADLSFPPSTPIYPPASAVLAYFRRYAEHFGLPSLIRLNTTVVSAEPRATPILNSSNVPLSNSDQPHWKVTVSTGESFYFDLVVVCSGKHRVPRYPDTPGLEAWLRKGKASHSAWYRRPADLSGNSVILVVGRGPSGRDITAELLSTSGADACASTSKSLSMRRRRRTIILSMTGASNEDKGNLKIRGRTSRFESLDDNDQGRVVFDDGTVESGIDHCLLATGYQMSFPFFSESVLRSVIPPFEMFPSLPDELYNTTYGVFPLARHIFPLRVGCNGTKKENLTLAFIGLPFEILPFPLAEAQARAIFHVFGDPNSLDCVRETKDIITQYKRLLSQFGNDFSHIAKAWHILLDMEYFDYRDKLHQLAEKSFGVIKVENWVRFMYVNKEVLEQVWMILEKNGEAEKWVRGVGENGREDWVGVLERMLNRAREEGLPVIEDPL